MVGGGEADQDAGQGGLAGSGLADDRVGGAFAQLEVDPVEGGQPLPGAATAEPVGLGQPARLQDVRGVPRCRLARGGSPARRRLQSAAPTRGGGQQPPGVRAAGVLEHRTDRAFFHDQALLHDQDAIGPVKRDIEVVGDQQDPQPEVVAQAHQVVEDASLNRHVERTGRLVGHDDLRLSGEGDGYQRPLLHPAAELVRVLVEDSVDIGESGRLQTLQCRRPMGRGSPAGAVGAGLVEPHRLDHLLADPLDRVQRGVGVLRDVPDVVTADQGHPFVVPAGHIHPRVGDRAAPDESVGRQQSQRAVDQGGLPRAGLADQRDELAGLDSQVDTAHGGTPAPVLDPVVHREVADPEQRIGGTG